MDRFRPTLPFIVLLTLLPIARTEGQVGPFGRPRADDTFNLGQLGAEGMPVTGDAARASGVPEGAVGIRVSKCLPEGPAEKAGLKEGDIIVGTPTALIPKKRVPIYALMEMLEAASTVEKSNFSLAVIRDGKRMAVKVALPFLGKHSATCPLKCARCEKLGAESLQSLAKMQGSDGAFEAGLGGMNAKVVVTTLAGLAFLASGSTPTEGPYAANIGRCTEFLVSQAGKEDSLFPTKIQGANWSQLNWQLGYAPLYLCEVYRLTKDEKVRTKLTELADAIARHQETCGGWAHGPGGPNALDYLELAIVNNWCLASLGAMQQMGIAVSPDAIRRGVAYQVETSSSDGGIGYSVHEGQKGVGDPGRTAGCVFAFCMLKMQGHKFFKRMGDYYLQNIEGIPNGHVSPVMHFTASALA
ncbi:MAG: hypothetical protein HYY93_02545 [Planctomycetes bacterium]|nr:hypothetical protein [Planctomycetota bacterium]